jgi:hypothetical protein
MNNIGILAYGSLQSNPGKEIERSIVKRIENVTTPFRIEFARSSEARDGAPTLIPVETGGKENSSQILVLNENISDVEASNMLWRRETHQVGNGKKYERPATPGTNTVLIERLANFHDVSVVLYTKIAANIDPLTAQKLAELAVKSAQSKAVLQTQDGISYLVNAKESGVQTPLMLAYEKEILKIVGAESLENALSILSLQRLKEEKKIPLNTEILTKPPTIKDAGKNVAFTAKIGKTYIRLAPPIALVTEYDGEKYPNSYTTLFLDLEAKVDNSYLYVGFTRGTTRQNVLDYFNNLMALFNIAQIPFDFVSPFDVLVQAKGMGTNVEFISSSKAHNRGYGIPPVEIQTIDFAKISVGMFFLWEKIKSSKYFEKDECFQLLGYAHYYLFHESYFLSFVHSWMFLESCINMLWQEVICEAFNIEGSNKKETPIEDERNWTTQIKIDTIFLKNKIDEDMRKDLQLIRNKRNKVFHRAKGLGKRTVNSEDAVKAALVGLKLFYTMIKSPPERGVVAFLDVRQKMWEAINRGPVNPTRIAQRKSGVS